MDADTRSPILEAATEGPPPEPGGWTRRLLEPRSPPRWTLEAARGATGLALSAIYGAALGARAGGPSIVLHAAMVPAALVVLVVLGLPALHILLALVGAPLRAMDLGAASARSLAVLGLLLAGLAAPVALLVITSESAAAAALAGGAGLVVSGALALRGLWRDLGAALAGAAATTRALAGALVLGFALFAVLLVGRLWWSALPVLGGAS